MQLDTGRLWYVPTLPAVELLTGRYQRQVFPWHAHAGYCLSLQEQGRETLALPGVPPQHVEPGQVVVLNPGQVHTNYAHAPGQSWQLRSFYLAPAWLEAVAPAGYGLPAFPRPRLDDPALYTALHRVHQRLERQGYSPAVTDELAHALRELVRRHGQPAAAPPPGGSWLGELPPLMRQLSPALGSVPTVATLAAAAGLSRFQFTRAVTQATGLPPQAYLTQRRLAQARHLLRAGASLVEAALATGFCDQSHFSHHFKRVVGVSPGQYRALACTNVQDYGG
ncbi:MAG: AraC family transcriptional regulator [Janthinobacterium lividum]